MSAEDSVRGACDRLFDQYPLAIRNPHPAGLVRSMVLMLEDDGVARFHVLSHKHGEDGPVYSLFAWPAGRFTDIQAEIRDGRPVDDVIRVLNHGVPIPLHGSLFGWRRGDSITAMITIYAQYAPPHTEPSWTFMPLADIPEIQWPPFAGSRFFGNWFWDFYQAGNIVSLSDVIANTSETVFWVDTISSLGSGSCVVAADVSAPEGYKLLHGRYVYYRVLQAGKAVPSPEALLSDESRVDLAAGFRQSLQL
jgi:hypothetical protein